MPGVYVQGRLKGAAADESPYFRPKALRTGGRCENRHKETCTSSWSACLARRRSPGAIFRIRHTVHTDEFIFLFRIGLVFTPGISLVERDLLRP